MIEHLEDGSVQGYGCIVRTGCQRGRRYTEHHKAHMIHGRVRYQPFKICLSKGRECAEDDGGCSQQGQRAGKYLCLKRIQREDESQKSIRTQFEQNTCQKHGASGRCFSVRVRQPGVEGPDGYLNGEGNCKCPERNLLNLEN